MVDGWETVEDAAPWVAEVLDFWFGLRREQWWGDAALDDPIRDRFEALWEEQRLRSTDQLVDSPAMALAAVILFDQVPRNMFRGTAKAFSTDALAIAIAEDALDLGFDGRLGPDQRRFLYMPFQHSEDIVDQQRALDLFARLGDAEALDDAETHHAVIARFGRFPSRNAVLGRASTAEEVAASHLGGVDQDRR